MLLLMGACTGPVRSFPVYESKARQTASAVASAAQTAALAVDAAAGDTFEGGGWLGHQRQPQNVVRCSSWRFRWQPRSNAG
jgi:hypothetical protein